MSTPTKYVYEFGEGSKEMPEPSQPAGMADGVADQLGHHSEHSVGLISARRREHGQEPS